MPSQQLLRLDERRFVLLDCELVLVLDGATTCADPKLLGLGFRTKASGWRVLRHGCVDIGFSPDANMAVQRILDDRSRSTADLADAVNKALPL